MTRSTTTALAAVIFVFAARRAEAGQKKPEPVYKLPVLTDDLDERIAMIRAAEYSGPQKHDCRSGYGYTGPELFELHRELRLLVHGNLDEAPTARELELLVLIVYGKPDRPITCGSIERKWRKKAAEGKEISLFYDGYDVNRLMHQYRATGDIDYLDCAVVQADYVMADHDRRARDRAGYETFYGKQCWLGIGRGFGGVAEVICEIANDPTLHFLVAVGGPEAKTGKTYIARAREWTGDLRRLIEFRKSHDKYDNGKWYETEKEVNYKGGPAATNRYLYYVHFLIATAAAAEAVDAEANAAWVGGVRKTVDEVMAYFMRACSRPEELRKEWFGDLIKTWSEDENAYIGEYGPYVIWSYKPRRHHPEDYIHLYMDMEAFDDIFRHDPEALPGRFMKRAARALMTCTHDYPTGRILFNMMPSGNTKNPLTQPPWHTYFNPPYGKWIGRYMNDEAYDKFMKRQLLIWDDRLIEGKLGRFSQYTMPKEIVEARWFRYVDDAAWPVVGTRLPLD